MLKIVILRAKRHTETATDKDFGYFYEDVMCE